MTPQQANELPELPEPFGSIDIYEDEYTQRSIDGFTADQMRGYALDYWNRRAPAPTSEPGARENLPPLPLPEMPHGSRDYFSAGQMKAYGEACAEPYSDLIRKLAFEYSAGGYNSEGLLSPELADSKLRWIIEDMRKWPRLDTPASPAVLAEQHRLDWDDVSEAATSANRALGQWMPEQWIQAFVKAYNKE